MLDEEDYVKSLPHLLLTPIRPDYWPYTFRLQLRLCHERGSLAKATSILEECDVNILFAECTESGYHHATWNVICEYVKLRKKYYNRHGEILRCRSDSLMKKQASEIAIELLGFLPDLEERLKKENKSQGFLRERFKKERLGSFEKESYDSKPEVWEKNSHLISRIINYSIMPNLMHYWRHGYDVLNPLEFNYREKKRLFEPYDSDNYSIFMEEHQIVFPCVGIGSFDTDEYCVRLHFLNEAQRERTFFLNIRYQMSYGEKLPSEENSSKGIIAKISDVLCSHKANNYMIRNSTKRQDNKIESGAIRLVCHIDDCSDSHVRQIKQSLEAIKMEGLKIKDCEPKKLQLGRVFLSIFEEASHKDRLYELINMCANSAGFEVNPQRANDIVEDDIVKNLRDCNAFIQVLTTKTSGDGSKEGDLFNTYGWLSGEYLSAVTLVLLCHLGDGARVQGRP